MRIREFLPESWWKDLDSNFLSMMGYSADDQQDEEIESDLATDVSHDMQVIKSRHP